MQEEFYKQIEEKENIYERPKKGSKKQIIIAIIIGLIIFSLGYLTSGGLFYELPQRLVGRTSPQRYDDVDFFRFWEALERVEDSYIGDIDYGLVVDGAIAGMVASLGDPFTTYIDKDSVSLFQNEINGSFEGIGAEISIRDGQLVIVAPLENSPAEKAGVKAGDIILTIDDVSVVFMTTDQAVMRIRGDKGTYVALAVKREGEDEIQTIKIKRGQIDVKSVEYELLDDQIAYIKLRRFDQSTKKLLDGFIKELKNEDVQGMVLDLRNNPGGYLETAIDVASEFIPDGIIVIEEYKDGQRDEIVSKGKSDLDQIPLVILVNQGSASASEIVAGAVQDRGRGILIGMQTFGKGTVQEVNPLSDGGALKVTVAKWLTPNGTEINKSGLTPEIEVELEGNSDDQLSRALEELKKIINN